VAALVTIALGIASASATFSVINAVMLRPLPYAAPDRLVVVWRVDSSRQTPVRTDLAEDWRGLSRSFDRIGWYRAWMLNVSGTGEPQRIASAAVSADLFTCLGTAPALGRLFLQNDMYPGSDHVAILSDSLWRRMFASDPRTVGKTVRLDGEPHTVIGVMPTGFQYLLPNSLPDTELWVPISRAYRPRRPWTVATAVGRLKPGVSVAQAEADIGAITKHLVEEGRSSPGGRVTLARLDRQVVGRFRSALMIAFGAVLCVLLIASINLMGMFLVWTAARRREIAVRGMLGASRSRLIRQLVTESSLVSVSGGALGIVLSIWIANAIVRLHPSGIPRLDEVRPDAWVILFGIAITGAVGMIAGLIPALRLSRIDGSEVLKQGRSGWGRTRGPFAPRRLLAVAQVALTLVLLIGAGLLVRSLTLLGAVDFGFNPEGLLTLTVPLPKALYGEPARQVAFARDLLQRAQTIPAVQSAAISNSLPMATVFSMTADLQIAGRRLPESESTVFLRAVTGDYFRTMRIALLRGRFLVESDEDRHDVALINQTAARQYWPAADPIGQRFSVEDGIVRTVVGVVADTTSRELDLPADREVYLPFSEQPTMFLGLVLRTSGDPRAAASGVRRAVTALDRDQPVQSVMTMREVIDRFLSGSRFSTVLLGSFSALALLLAVVGTYGVVAYSVKQRTHEIAVRMAVGARRGSVLWMVLADGAALAGTGVVIGLTLALIATRWMRTLLFGITPLDPPAFLVSASILLAGCLLASYLPARLATRIDPMRALREH
jgi:putative ABC transport system permease protein